MEPSSLKRKTCTLDPQVLAKAVQKADTNGNGSLFDPQDRLPEVKCGLEDGVALLDASLYQALLDSKKKSVSLTLFTPDAGRHSLDNTRLLELMKENGGHPLRVADLARLYPEAKIGDSPTTLRQLALIKIQSQNYPEGASLGDAYLDPGGELIVSHFYFDELRRYAPKFAQFMAVRSEKDESENKTQDPRCHKAETAFFLGSCHPDSWPVDLDTLLSLGRLEISAKTLDAGFHQTRHEALVKLLRQKGSSLKAVSLSDSQDKVTVDLKDEEALREVLRFLNTQFPPSDGDALLCDPAQKDHVAYHLGISRTKVRSDEGGKIDVRDLRRMLVTLVDDRSTKIVYRPEDANDPARFNRAAGRPSLHFTARLSPKNPDQVVFGIFHIEAQSYLPRGNHVTESIKTPADRGLFDDGSYKHQGETEPVYLRFERTASWPYLKPLKAYLGHHYIAEPVPFEKYRDGVLAIAYGSGARAFLGEESRFETASALSRGVQATSLVSLPTMLGIFSGIEAYPGRQDLMGPSPTAALFVPASYSNSDKVGPGEYQLILEGKDGDLLPTGRLLTINGTGKGGIGSGYPFFRGSRFAGTGNDQNRTMAGLYDFLERQDSYHDNHEMGRIGSVSLSAGLPIGNGVPGGHRLSLRYEQNSLLHLDQFGLPLVAGFYLFNPIVGGKLTGPPHTTLHVTQTGAWDHRWRLDTDFSEIRLGVAFEGLQLVGYGRFGAGVGIGSDGRDFAGNIYFGYGASLIYQRDFFEVGLSADGLWNSSPKEAGRDGSQTTLYFGPRFGIRFQR